MAQLGQAIAAQTKISKDSSPLQNTSGSLVVHSEPPSIKETRQQKTLSDDLNKNGITIIGEPPQADSSPPVVHSEPPSQITSSSPVDYSGLPIGEGLTQKGLARRLGRSDVAVINARKGRDAVAFAAWSRKRDPQALAWQYRGGRYYPIE